MAKKMAIFLASLTNVVMSAIVSLRVTLVAIGAPIGYFVLANFSP